jgi:hypothetical protein
MLVVGNVTPKCCSLRIYTVYNSCFFTTNPYLYYLTSNLSLITKFHTCKINECHNYGIKILCTNFCTMDTYNCVHFILLDTGEMYNQFTYESHSNKQKYACQHISLSDHSTEISFHYNYQASFTGNKTKLGYTTTEHEQVNLFL